MKKNVSGVLLSLLVAGSLLAACSDEESNETVEETASETEETTEESTDESTDETNEDEESTESNSEESESEDTAKSETDYPITLEIADFNGETYSQEFEAAPERVIANNLSSAEMLFELGVGDKIVGITQPDNAPTGDWADDINNLEVLGDKMNMSQEVIVGADPDLVVGRSMMFDDEGMGSFSTLNDLGIKAYSQVASNPTTVPELSSVTDDVRNLGEIFNVNDRAEEYAQELEARHEAVVENVEEKKGDEELTLLPIVAYDGANQSFNIFNITGGLQESMLSELNVVPAIEGPSKDPSFETIINADPDIILYVTADRNAELDETAVDYIKNEPLLEGISALQNDRVYTISYDDFMDYGARIYDALEILNEEIYGE